MGRARAVIFDLDGTLIDSVGDIGRACNQTLRQFGLPEHPLAAYRYFVGDGVERLIERAMAPLPFDAAVLAAHKVNYAQFLLFETQPYPGIADALAQLSRAGVALAVLSNKADALTKQAVAHFFADVPFVAVAGQRPDVPRKPEPDAALALCAQLGVTPQGCVFVGDTSVDIATARNAKIRSIGVQWGSRPEEAARADVAVTTVAEMVAAILG